MHLRLCECNENERLS